MTNLRKKIQGLVTKVKRKYNVYRIKRSANPRPGSFPYISGDGFRQIADRIYDETGKCRPEEIAAGNIVFVKSDYLHEFFRDVHPLIKNPYKLISHNSDYNITPEDLKYIDEKIIHWYGQNVYASHPKLTPIPFGLDNLYYYHLGVPDPLEKINRRKETPKKNRIVFGFSINTNPKERQPAHDYLTTAKLAEPLIWETDPEKYFSLVNEYKFIACPSGNGLDDPRTWQALYLKVVPITNHSVTRDYFRSIGLPILVIDKWSDLSNFTESDLATLYGKFMTDSETAPLYMDYWIKKIKQ
ncbi:MAG: hypothetical protein NTY66_01880 [Candidatus Vogelbacteria bacterium]|nr:hypothetical protein [Candidatus Vogelbacteria bacterium]